MIFDPVTESEYGVELFGRMGLVDQFTLAPILVSRQECSRFSGPYGPDLRNPEQGLGYGELTARPT